jgi:HAD superfamily hydrolase (TIGR01509 family)
MANLQGILFDLGDTLLDFGPVDTIELFEQGARLAYGYLQQLKLSLPSLSVYHRKQLRAIRWAYAKSLLTRREFNSLDLMERTARSMGHRLTREQLEELVWLWYQPLGRQATIEPGLGDVLDGLTRGGLKLGLVSNTFIPASALDRHLRQENLLQFFPVRVYSCHARYRKPHPAIFHMALEAAGLPARSTMFVGDSPKADVYGAHMVGMKTVLKDPTGARKPYNSAPDHTIRSLSELPGIVAKYRRDS